MHCKLVVGNPNVSGRRLTCRRLPSDAVASLRGAGPLPLHPAEVPGPENDEPKGNSVPGENLEIVAADIAYQGAHGERRAHEGCNRTDPNDREIVEFDRVPRFEEFQYRCAEYRRNRQEK